MPQLRTPWVVLHRGSSIPDKCNISQRRKRAMACAFVVSTFFGGKELCKQEPLKAVWRGS